VVVLQCFHNSSVTSTCFTPCSAADAHVPAAAPICLQSSSCLFPCCVTMSSAQQCLQNSMPFFSLY
jgi:hypothetical protein